MQTKQRKPNKMAQSKHKETKNVITQRGELIMLKGTTKANMRNSNMQS